MNLAKLLSLTGSNCPSLQLPMTERLYGIEIEVENVPSEFIGSRTAGRAWTCVKDGSLRRHGAEFRSKPLGIRALPNILNSFYDCYRVYDFRSHVRTSIHVHIDMRALSLAQIRAIMVTYSLVEPLLFRVCGEDRESNIYCVPLYRANEELPIVSQALNPLNVGKRTGLRALDRLCKYTALYAEPLRRFGTLEFRQAPTWSSPEPVMNWIRSLSELVEYGTLFSSEQVLEQMDELGPNDFVRDVFGDTWEFLSGALPLSQTAENLLDKYDTLLPATMLAGERIETKMPEEWAGEGWTQDVPEVELRIDPFFRNRRIEPSEIAARYTTEDPYIRNLGEEEPM